MHKKKDIFLAGLLFLLITVFLFVSESTKAAWYNEDWIYRKAINISYSGSALTDFDVLAEIDTATLISAGKLQSDCDDLRFADSDETTLLDYWIEGGCNTSTTQVWVQVPSIPDGGKAIYVYYGNSGASSASLAWAGAAPVNWYNASWGYRRKITFDNSAQAENLAGFPVLVKLNSSRINYANTQNSGQDIRFTDSDGTTLLSYEIEKWDETGDSFVWVKIPQVDASSSSDYIYVYYGNASAVDAQAPTSVWDSNFQAIWHLSENPAGTAPQILDTTANNNDGTSAGTMTSGDQVSGQIDGSLDFDGTNDVIDFASNASLNIAGNTTVEGWFKLNSNFTSSSTATQIIVDKYTDGNNNFVIALVGTDYSQATVADGSLVFKIEEGGAGARYKWTSQTSWTAGTWYHFTTVLFGAANANNTVYINGVLDVGGTVDSATTDDISYAGTWAIGGSEADQTSGQRFFAGVIDEVRVSNTDRSAAWIAATYKSGADTFNTFASEETFSAPDGSFTLMNVGSCPAGWTQNTDFDNAFPQGAAVYGGTGGSSSHGHNTLACTSGVPSSTSTAGGGGGTGVTVGTHTHDWSIPIDNTSSVLPPYVSLVMCKKADLVIPANFIAMYDTSVPSGWTRYSTLDGRFPGAIGVNPSWTQSVDFETGDTSQFNSVTQSGGGTIAADASAALAGSFGGLVTITLGTAGDLAYGVLSGTTNQTEKTIEFHFDPNGITMADATLFNLVHAIGSGAVGGNSLTIRLRFTTAGGYTIDTVSFDDAGAGTAPSQVAITDAPHKIRVVWKAATGVGNNDGYLYLYIDGVLVGSLTGIDNDSRDIDAVRFGATINVGAGTGGTFFMDNAGVFDGIEHPTSPETQGGASTHSHTSTANTPANGGATATYEDREGGASRRTPHTHTLPASTVDTSDHTPPFLDLVFGQKDSQGAAPVGTITMVDSLPPLGWTRFSALDSKLPRGAATYGGTGGGATHTHTKGSQVSDSTTGGSNVQKAGGGASVAVPAHTHTCSGGTTDSSSSIPPYKDTVFAQKNDPAGDNSLTVSLGPEDSTIVPANPTASTATTLSTTSVRWGFTDNSVTESGFKVYDESGNLKVTCASANLTFCDETGLSANTQYTRKFTAYSGTGESVFSATVSKYTSSVAPTAPNVDNRKATTIEVVPSYGANPSTAPLAIYKEVGTTCDGSGGSYIAADGSDNGATAVWQTAATWGTATVTGLAQSQNEYAFCVIARNGDNEAGSFGPAGFYRACSPSLSGNHTVTQDCSFLGIDDGNNAQRVANGVDAINAVGGTGNDSGQDTNKAKLTVQSGILTVNANETLAVGSLELTGGSVAIADGGVIKVGTPVWMVDADADGFPSVANKYYVQNNPPTNGRRRNLMQRADIVDCDDAIYQPHGCLRKPVTITYSGSALTNYDILLSVDTASLISAGKMQSDCGDIRIKDSDGSTALTYWLEGGCNTSATQIWVLIPSIPDGGKTIYFDYEGSNIANGTESWSGNFTLLNNASCPTGWSRNVDYDGKFLYGASTYGTAGGADSHGHSQINRSSGAGGTAGIDSNTAYDERYVNSGHTHTSTIVDVNSTSGVIPPYLDMVICNSPTLDIKTGLIGIFDTSAPTGWTRFIALDSTFPRGAASYGATGGASTHSHTTSGGYSTSFEDVLLNQRALSGTAKGMAEGHAHSSNSGSTATGSSIPPYIDTVYGSKDSDGVAPSSLITLATALPPRGWTRFSAFDSLFARGAASYGGTGGASTHVHSVTITTTASANTSNVWANGASNGAAEQHTHSSTGDSDAQSNIPAYVQSIYVKKNTPTPTAALGSEGYR